MAPKCFFLCTLYVKGKSPDIEHVVGPIFCDKIFEKKKGLISLLETKPNLKTSKITAFPQNALQLTMSS